MKNKFNSKRLIHFIQRQATLNFSSLLINIAALAGILLLVSLWVALKYPAGIANLIQFYLFALYLCGFIFTSKIFDELHNPQKSYAYLTLPVSTTEKLVGSWLLSSPLYILLSFILFSIFYFIACMLGNRMDDYASILNTNVWHSIGVFIVLQTIFFLGAVYFRKNNFMKVIFAIFLFAAIISIYTGSLVAFSWTTNGSVSKHFMFEKEPMTAEIDTIKYFFWFLLAPFMLLTSYFKLKERQV